VKIILKGGHVVDPQRGINGVADVVIANGRIAAVGKQVSVDDAAVVQVPRGWVVSPGLIDMHVHLREPGQEHKETIASGSAASPS
jgi:dihydroorotase